MSKKEHCRRCSSTMKRMKGKIGEGKYWQCRRFPKDFSHRKGWNHTSDMRMGSKD